MEGKISKDFLVKINLDIFKNEKLVYVLVSGVISVLGFMKSFLFLKFFDFFDLGIINISQNFIITISLLQIGIITGGYRLYCYKKGEIVAMINSTVLYFFFILFAFLLLGFLVAIFFFDTKISSYLLFFFLITGLLSLYGNWVTCKMLAVGKIRLLNVANLISAALSLSIIFLYKYIGVWAALSTFLTQSFILIAFSYYKVPEIKPVFRSLKFKRVASKIISLGFVPYLTTAMGYFNSQLGRWLITLSLGTLILGKTSLVNLYVTLVNVFPTAITNLFFPTLISKYELGDMNGFSSSLRRYFMILVLYLSATILLTVLLSNFVVSLLFPKHLESLNLVYTILPSLFFLCLSNPIIVVLNASKNFKAIFFGSLISITVYLFLLVVYLYKFEVKLIGFFAIESISSCCFFIYNCFVFKKIIQKKSYE